MLVEMYAPEPPVAMPPARTVQVPGRGECFVRDSGGDGPPVLLLHGWTVTADLNWYAQYGPLADAGFRVLALDHRGHGRGIRALENFDLEDCADDAAGVLRELGIGPAVVAGYSMGGPISLLTARRHPDGGPGARAVRDVLALERAADAAAVVVDGTVAAAARRRAVQRVPWHLARGRDAGQRRDDVGGGRTRARLGARHRRGRARAGPLRRSRLARRAPRARRRWS